MMADPLPPKQLESFDTPDEHLTFMGSQWRKFAAFAWEKYLSEGRGAVVIDLKRASRNEGRFQVPTFYLAEGSEKLHARGGWPNAEVAEVIRESNRSVSGGVNGDDVRATRLVGLFEVEPATQAPMRLFYEQKQQRKKAGEGSTDHRDQNRP